jgi:hypothetical protein
MSAAILMMGPRDIRGVDINSLLRIYDFANRAYPRLRSQYERARADKAILRITNELRRREVRF